MSKKIIMLVIVAILFIAGVVYVSFRVPSEPELTLPLDLRNYDYITKSSDTTEKLARTPEVLIKNPTQEYGFHPRFSNDGAKIAFNKQAKGAGSDTGLWVMNSYGTGLRQLTSREVSTADVANYGWSPNDKLIFFKAAKGGLGTKVQVLSVVDVETGNVTEVFEAERLINIWQPKWISQNEIAFVLYDDKSSEGALAIVDIRTPGKLKQKPDQKIIMYFTADPYRVLGKGIVTSVDTSGVVKQLTDSEVILSPIVSPDGKEILYRKMGQTINWVIMNSDGSNKRNLPFDGEHIAWSPNGVFIAYDIVKDDGHNITESDIYIINKDGTGVRRLTESADKLAMEPSWSPGRTGKIVFVYRRTAEIAIIETIEPEEDEVNVYFTNSTLEPIVTCSEVVPVVRKVEKTLGIATAAIEELLGGLIPEEVSAGYHTEIPPGSKLNSLTIVDGEARVDFDDKINEGGGSCHFTALREQIRQTLLQFSTIKTVRISVEGRTENIFQP